MATAIAVLFTGLLLAVNPTGAAAGTDNFCAKGYAAYENCYGPAHSLTSVVSANSSTEANSCAGALNYGQMVCASDYACHTYGGNNVLTPRIKNNVNGPNVLYGYSTWGSTPAYNGCPRGGAQRVPADRQGAVKDAVPALATKDPAASALPSEARKAAGLSDNVLSRRFATPAGDSWVVADVAGDKACLVIADPTDGFGIACSTTGTLLEKGLALSLGNDTDATVVAVNTDATDADQDGVAVVKTSAAIAAKLVRG